MKLNLDLAAAALAPWQPRSLYAHSPALILSRFEVFSPLSSPRRGCLYLLTSDEYNSLPPSWANAGCSFIVADAIESARPGMPALSLEAPCEPQELVSVLLDTWARLDAWAEEVLRAIAAGAPLQEVFDIIARAFANPLMLSDSALLFVLTAGSLPAGFQDRFWTPTMETGVCPVERYSETWRHVSSDGYLRKRACLVKDRETGRHYIYRNLVDNDGMHGMFELVDINAPFTDADIALVEYVADLLMLAVHRRTYQELSNMASDPLYSLLAGRPVSELALRKGLEKREWDVQDAYYVCFAMNSVDMLGRGVSKRAHLSLTADVALIYPSKPGNADFATETERYEMGRHVQQQLERNFPRSCVFSTNIGCVMVVREKDHPFAEMRDSFVRKALEADDPIELLVGISSVRTDFRKLSAARSQAERAVAWAETEHGGMLGHSRACFYDDVFCLDLADRLGIEKDANWLVPESVAQLAAKDAEESTEYVATLRAYLEHGCNVNRAADALFVHRNTLAYRIKRIKAIAGMDLERFDGAGDDLLRIWLACRLLKDIQRP